MDRSPKALRRAFADPRSYTTRRRVLTATLAAGIVVLAGLMTTRASAVAAGCNVNASPSSFSSAVSAAAPGQTVCLASGDYGNWRGTNKAITVEAAAGASPTMQISFGSGASSFTLSGMHGMGGSVASGASNITVQNSVFSSELSVDGGSGIVINHNDFSYQVQSTNGGPNAKIYLDTSGGSPGSAVSVENNVIENGDLDGVHVAGGSGMLILGNVIANLCDRGVNHTDDIQFEGGSQIRVANNYVYEAQNCPTQGITAYDGNTHGLLIDDNVVDVPRDWGIELYSDSGSTVVHNTVVYHPNSYSEFNTPTGQIDIDRKSQDPAGSGTQVYDNIATVDFTNGSTGTAHNNVSGQRAVYVGPTNTWAGFKLAANSPVGLKAASDGLDDGVRVTVAPNTPIPSTGSSAPGGKKTSPSKGGSGGGGSKRAGRGLAVTRFHFSPASFHALAGHAARSRRHARGTAIMFHLSRKATVKIAIVRALRGRRADGRCVKPKRSLRKHPGCIRYQRTGTLVYKLKGGNRTIPYRGRMHGHRLKRGTYLATVVASAGKRHSKLRVATFRVL
jgi:Right handed beta helix region